IQTGTLTAKAAEATGLPAGLPVIAGGGDGQCAGTGAGVSADHPDRAYINLGTALVSGSYGSEFAHHRAFRTEIAIADRGYIFETCLRSGTFLVDWLARELFASGAASKGDLLIALEKEAAASPIGANGRPIQRSDTVEASSLGAAIAAAKGAGWHRTIAEGVAAMAGKPVRTFEPDPKRAARYAELRAIHAELWPRLADWNGRLSSFAEQA